jgi:oligopeptidase B
MLQSCSSDKTNIPFAKKVSCKLVEHNHTRIDNYYWLNERENPEVLNYLKAENKYTEVMTAHTKPLEEKLFKEIVGRIAKDDQSLPYKENGYYYYVRFKEKMEYPVYCRKKGSLDAPEEIMLDVNEMAKGHDYYNVTSLHVSSDNRLLSFGVDAVGRFIYDIHIKDLQSGEIVDQAIKNSTGSAVWANDNRTLFYTVRDASLRPHEILKHRLGESVDNDQLVYTESDSTFDVSVYKSKSERYIMIVSQQTLSNECRFLDADNPDGEFKIFQSRQKDLEYHVEHFGDYFYILTNDHAKNFRLMKTRLDKTELRYWQELVAHRNDVLIETFELFKHYFVLQERKNGLTQLHIFSWENSNDYYLEFGEAAYSAYLSANPEFNTDILRYGYSSLTTPASTYDFNMSTKEKVLMKEQRVEGDFDKNNYQTERLWATARDGIKVPISLVYRKNLKKDGMPMLLYAYGSYGYSIDPDFNSNRLSLLDRGFIFAIAHIRGGQEMGRQWYEDGKLLKKKNTFYDYIDCAEYLIEKKYTSSEKLFAMGGSAGGLLMGAVINMAPDLFKGVVAAVPFVDVVTTMLDESIPLTTGEYDEWGNPHIKKYYDYILSYSPYDNVKEVEYPALLVTTGLHDSQVQYWEPAKWVAKLRDLKKGNNVLLLKINMDAGHSGTTGRFKRQKEIAFEYAFILDQK